MDTWMWWASTPLGYFLCGLVTIYLCARFDYPAPDRSQASAANELENSVSGLWAVTLLWPLLLFAAILYGLSRPFKWAAVVGRKSREAAMKPANAQPSRPVTVVETPLTQFAVSYPYFNSVDYQEDHRDE